jgi:drug/metabolite transporter (DMT)-like permease
MFALTDHSRRELLVVSFLFAGIITLSNIGLDKVSLNVHVLLRTTSFVWVILFSLFLKGERPTLLQLLFASFVISGAVLLSIDAGKDWVIFFKICFYDTLRVLEIMLLQELSSILLPHFVLD